MMPKAANVAIHQLSYRYPDGQAALRDVELSVDAGQRVAILGPNGAGKTTLALHLNGLLSPASGQVEIDGERIARENLPQIRQRVALVFQDPDDQLFMPTIAADVAFGPQNAGLGTDEVAQRVKKALRAVDMWQLAQRPAHHLSFGQRRRAALATVLAMDPGVLILDEPSSNLDPVARRELADIIAGLDITVIMITHDVLYALQLCDRSVVLNEGRVTGDGPTAAILSNTALMHANRLELPYGVEPSFISRCCS